MTQQSQALVYVMCMPLYYQEYKFSLKTSPYYASGADRVRLHGVQGAEESKCTPWSRVGNSIIDFLMESIVFCDWKINSIMKKIESLQSIFFKDQQDWLALFALFLF